MGHREFRFGDWQVDVDSNTLSDGATRIPLEPRAMEVLRYLCRHPGAVIPAEELLQACWGSAEFGDNPVHKAITQLRRALGDSSTEPRYIETIRKRGYRAIAEVVEAEEDGQVVWTSGSPFRGLEPFQENHAAIFFGRMQATARLKELVEKQTRAGRAMALVLGPSGSGKTSLVRAGLMPQLMRSNAGEHSPITLDCTLYLDCADLGEGSIFHALAAVLIDAEYNNTPFFPGESADSLSRKLEFYEIEEIFLSLPDNKPVVGIFVDRLEAIFRAKDINNDKLERFIELLHKLSAHNSTLVLMACRNDFYPDIIALPRLIELKNNGGHFDLTTPDGVDIAQIIRLPAKAAHLTYEIDLVSGANLDDVLCDAARGSPDTLPLLQYCLNELYRQRNENGMLRFDVFRQLGGIEGAIGIRAEQIITSLTTEQAGALPQILSLLVNVGDEQSAVTARSVAWSALRNDEERDFVRAMVEARLFVSELTGDIPSFSVAHEALLRRWPRVAEWIEHHRHALQLRSRISSQADRWVKAERPRDLLLPKGTQISQAYGLLDLKGFSLSDHEFEYIAASIQRAKIGRRLQLLVAGLVVVLAISAGLLGLTARSEQRKAEQHRAEAEGLMSYMLGEFVEKLRPIGRLDLLDDVSERALDYLANIEDTKDNSAASDKRAKALQTIAEVNIARSNPQKAKEALIAARSIWQLQDISNSKNAALLKNLGSNAFWLGQIHLNRGDWAEAEKYFLDYKNYIQRSSHIDPENIDNWIEESYAHNNLGTLALKKGDLEDAQKAFSKSIELKYKAFSKTPNNKELVAGLANSLSWLAETHAKLGSLEKAMALHQEEEELLRKIHATAPRDALWMARLANTLTYIGDLYITQGQQQYAQEAYSKAESFLLTITKQDPSNKSWEINLYNLQLKLLDVIHEKKDLNIIKQKQEIIHSKLGDLLRADPNRANLSQLHARAKQNLALTNFRTKHNTQSSLYLDDSLKILDEQHKKNNSDQQILALMANAILLRSEIEYSQGEIQKSKTSCLSVQKLLSKTANTSTDYRILAPNVRSYLCTGEGEKVKKQIGKLESMRYNEQHHKQYCESHHPAKGKL
ncbi:winged helix-turn-helix domain-containing protein [Massilia sp. erpn]|uniref:nSTAND1 domain-containing NTPase n=1 Tax=Massilia sp. erpn TaxID=2738142 RepID=UPI002106BF3F|nr:winged helix-turn-helix domain-containing protein [Massilia sp. erpn]